MSLDLSTLVAKESAEVELVHPVTKAPLGMFISVSGPGAEKYQEARFEAAKRRIDAGEKEITAKDLRATSLDLMIAAVIGWRGIVMNGEEIAYSESAAKSLLATPGLYWIRDQIDSAIGRIENFVKA